MNTGTHGNFKGETIFTNPKKFLNNEIWLEGANLFLQEDAEMIVNKYDYLNISL